MAVLASLAEREKNMSERKIDAPRWWARGATLAVFALAALIAGCGGGGDSGSDTAQAEAITTGPVSGFGSIIVNGVRFDDSSAEVEDEDGARSQAGHLKLGTMVEIESERIDEARQRAIARRIRFGSEIVGPVASVDVAAASFVVLGQVVEVRPQTVFDDALGADLASLEGQVVEVHALFDAASGRYVATRVEAEDDAPFYKLRGPVSALDTTARRFRIGDALISYASIADADLPANFADGARVRVRLAKTQVAGEWVAVTIRSGVRRVEDHAQARIRGTVSAFTSATVFEVNGLPVDASAAEFDHGRAGLELGARVEVRGKVVAGVLIAERVKVLHDADVRGVELHGTVSELDPEARTFMLRGLRVLWGDATVLRDGGVEQLVDGAKVEVKGVLSADRSSLVAVVIEFES